MKHWSRIAKPQRWRKFVWHRITRQRNKPFITTSESSKCEGFRPANEFKRRICTKMADKSPAKCNYSPHTRHDKAERSQQPPNHLQHRAQEGLPQRPSRLQQGNIMFSPAGQDLGYKELENSRKDTGSKMT